MKLKLPLFFLLFATMPACSVLGAANADECSNAMSIFDGESLNGWTVSEENPESFVVEDGAIVAKGARAHLFYDNPNGCDFTNFELTLTVKTEPGSNSGVFFHTQYQAEDWPSHGIEAQVNATQHDPRKTGSLYAIADVRVYSEDEIVPLIGLDTNFYVTLDTPPHADSEWFEYKIRVEDDTATTWVDGKMLTSWRQPETWPDEMRRLGSGTFALQAHDPDSVVYYKDIRVKRLTAQD